LRDGIHDNFIVEYHRLSFIITGGNDVEVQETFCDFDRSALQDRSPEIIFVARST